jgi:hypothetical protein
MTTPEDRLRDALTAVAALVQPEEDGERSAGRVPRVPRRLGQRYVPIAAAAAVLLVVTASVLVGSVRGHRTTGLPDTTPAPAAPAKYFVANVQGAGVSVRDAHTGRVAATVRPPAGTSWTAVSAAADPHVFYLAAQASDVRLYRLGIDDAGRVGSLNPVADFSAGDFDLVSLAASPDGVSVAYPVANPGKGPYGPAEIDVLDLSSKRRTVFRMAVTGRVSSLSWAADGRHLAYQLDGSANGSDGVWILDTHTGRDLAAASHNVLHWQTVFVGSSTNPVLSADGRHVYLIAADQAHGRKSTQIIELDARTGRRQRVLYGQPYSKGGNAQWAFTELVRDPTGRSLLAVDDRGHAHRVDIATGRATTFRFPGGTPNALAW